MPTFGEDYRDEEEMAPVGVSTVAKKPSSGKHAAPTAAAEDDTEAKAKCCGVPRRFVTPIFAGIALVICVTMILAGSGRTTASRARPKAIVFIIEGLVATSFEELAVQGNRAPNMRGIISQGKHAVCYSRSDTRCCRTQSGPRLGPSYTFQSAPGLASILTGVDASKHQVYNTSFDAMLRFAATSQTSPTFLKVAVDAGLRTGAIGTNAMLTTIGSNSACSAYGVLDFECGATAISRCMRSTSCNLVDRMPLVTADTIPSQTVADDMLADVKRQLASGVDVLVVHMTRVNKAAVTASGGNFSSMSRAYAAQLYLADAIVGQVVALVTQRAHANHENWLILGTSDHGGHNRTFDTVIDRDDIVPLFASVQTAGGAVPLKDPVAPVRHMDVAATVLEWFGLLSAPIASNLDGRVQFICGLGSAAGNCSGRV